MIGLINRPAATGNQIPAAAVTLRSQFEAVIRNENAAH